MTAIVIPGDRVLGDLTPGWLRRLLDRLWGLVWRLHQWRLRIWLWGIG